MMKNGFARLVFAGLIGVACVGSDPDTSSSSSGGLDAGSDTSANPQDGGDSDGASNQDGGDASAPLEGKMAWATTFGTTQPAAQVAMDGAGNVYAIGTFAGTVMFGGTSYTSSTGTAAWVVKLGPTGDVLWAKKIASSDSSATGDGIAVDTGGDVYISGSFTGATLDAAGQAVTHGAGANISNGYWAKLSKTDGAGIWAKGMSASNSTAAKARCTKLAIHNTSDLAFACAFLGDISYIGMSDSFTPADAAVVGVIDAANGARKWSELLRAGDGVSEVVVANGVDIDSAKNVYVAGDSSATKMHLRSGEIQGGAKKGAQDGFVVKIAADGNSVVWVQMFGVATSGKTTKATSLRLDQKDGSVYVGGAFQKTDFGKGTVSSTGGGTADDAYVVKLASTKDHQWQKTFGNEDAEVVNALDVDGAGRVVVLGDVASLGVTVDGKTFPAGAALFVMKLEPTGVADWVTGRLNSGNLVGRSVAAGPSGASVIGGSFSGTVDFHKSVTATASSDAFVVGLTP